MMHILGTNIEQFWEILWSIPQFHMIHFHPNPAELIQFYTAMYMYIFLVNLQRK